MSLSDYMPFFGDDFFEAMSGKSPVITAAYLQAIWHYWKVTHTSGLEDDSESLRRICRVDPVDWSMVRVVVFDDNKCFRLEGDLWHQKRARKEWKEASEKYNRAVRAAKIGAAARWGK